MIIKSRAPFRIGLAGGGTDVDPYASLYGGEVVNATIGLYARTLIETTNDGMLYAEVKGFPALEIPMDADIHFQGNATDLVAATYARFRRDHGLLKEGLIVQVIPDVSVGSGLGTSSTIVVSLCGAFLRLYGKEWDSTAIAEYAYSIEREDLSWPGGRQDQYAAVFGGFNHFSFGKGNKVTIEKLDLAPASVSMLEQCMILFHSKQQRHSSAIITEQAKFIAEGRQDMLQASHRLRELALEMRDALKREDLPAVGKFLDQGFSEKKKIATGISNAQMETICLAAIRAGAMAAKISGAGGGGFILFFTSPSCRVAVQQALATCEGQEYPLQFTGQGLSTWTM